MTELIRHSEGSGLVTGKDLMEKLAIVDINTFELARSEHLTGNRLKRLPDKELEKLGFSKGNIWAVDSAYEIQLAIALLTTHAHKKDFRRLVKGGDIDEPV